MPFDANELGFLFVFIAFLAFATKRGMTYLHFFQQEEYDSHRFIQWMMRNMVFDKQLSFALLVIEVLWFFMPTPNFAWTFVFLFVFAALIEKDPRKASKKKLVMTGRAKRILFIYLLIAALMGMWTFMIHISFLWIFVVQLLPLFLVIANTALMPYENYVQKRFWTEAHNKLLSLKPTVVGITGSFGKTSVKHILGHILKSYAPTLITPGSVNTPMGVTRIIREQLDDNHKFFVVEMGAYGPGSIERLCRLAPPDLGVITAIGHAHYERFKSIETVASAKFELAEAVLAKGGTVVIHEQVLTPEHARPIVAAKKAQFVVCGPSEVDDVWVLQATQTAAGLSIGLKYKGQSYDLTVPLYGLHHAQNVAMAFGAAVTLGVPADHAVTALKSVPQITHRLEVKHVGETVLIDDAFNSNPEGFKSALNLMPTLTAAGGGRKILVTPGMVELGAAHDEAHRVIGKQAAEICDVIIVVQPERIPSFTDEIIKSGKTFIDVQSFSQASAWLDKNRQPGDVVLLENDLPDIYEGLPKI